MKYIKPVYSEPIFIQCLTEQKKEVKKGLRLTSKEIEILKKIAIGFTSQEIANIQCRSYHTVTTHIRNIYKKLSVNSRAEAVFKACQNEIL